MGIDFLDFTFRVEREFKIKLKLETLTTPRDSKGFVDPTAAEVLHWVQTTLVADGRKIPEDCWRRVQSLIAATASVPIETVVLESRLRADLGFG